MVVRGGIEPPTPRSSGARFDANWANYGELSEIAVAEAMVGWTDERSWAGFTGTLA
jgi:hypothetical protein